MFSKKIVMLVDDDADDRFFFREALSLLNQNFICIEFENADKALIDLQQNSIVPDYIFTDLNGPFTNGALFLKELKKNKRLENVPVFIFSSSVSDPVFYNLSEFHSVYSVSKACSINKFSYNISEELKIHQQQSLNIIQK